MIISMRKAFLFVCFLIPFSLFAQEKFTVRGRIVDDKGDAVEYVQVGIPQRSIGTVSSVDGHFEITVPRDTLEFFHVSYQTGYYVVTGPADDVVVTLYKNELPPAVFIGGNTKEKYLLRPGTKVMGGLLQFSPHTGSTIGVELGSVAVARKPFLVQDIQFSIQSNSIPGCVVSVNIYRIEGPDKDFVNMLQSPLYVNVAESAEPQQFHVQPEDTILLEPGKYYISFLICDCDKKAVDQYLSLSESEQLQSPMSLDCILYLKSSFIRKTALDKMEPMPVNIGMVVKGLEYQ